MRVLAALVLMLTASAAFAEPHPCEADALAQAGPLLALHFNDEGSVLAESPGEPDGSDAQAWSLDEHATVLTPVKALVGVGKFDVLEVNGYIYRATYRMHFIYAQVPDACLLMGQEIIEVSDPY